jgi:hypothetical protein
MPFDREEAKMMTAELICNYGDSALNSVGVPTSPVEGRHQRREG